MPDKLITIKEVVLKNNCPECYSKEGLRLTFKQRFKETNFYKLITDEVKYEIECKTCNTSIYPVLWTEDIERVFEYQKKAFTPKKASRYFKKASWIVIISVGILILTMAFLMLYTHL